jgi:RNA polymerase sigma-70 factor (ECF subfamily)
MAHREIEDLFERFRRDGDAAALGSVFDTTAADLLALARRVTRDRAEADDVLQSTFLAAIERAASFERGREPPPVARRDPRAPGGPRAPAPRRGDGGPRRRKLQHGGSRRDRRRPRARRRRRERARAALPADREVLVPLLLDGRRAVDIARALERRPDTVHMRIHRGLARLRRLLPAGFLGLAPVRVEVLRAARAAAGRETAVATSAAAIGGVLLVNKLVLAAAGAAVVSTLAWLAWPTGSPAAPAIAASEPPPQVAALESVEPSAPVEPPAPWEKTRSRIEAPEAPGAPGASVATIEVVEADGRPASGIAAAIVDARSSVKALTAGADGCIRIEASREPVEIIVGRPDLFPLRVPLVLEPGPHRIELPPGRAVSGRVRVDGAPPAEPIVLRLFTTPSPLAGLEPVAEIARALGCEKYDSFSLALETSADGSFRASGLPDGWYGSLQVPRIYTLPDAPPNSFGNQSLALESPAEGLVIDLERMKGLRGRVVEAGDGQPVSNARLMARAEWSPSGNTTEIGTTADASGRFEMPLSTVEFRSIRFTTVTDAESRGSATATFRREDLGPDLDLGDLLLERPPSRDLALLVRDPQGNPIPKALASAGDLVSAPTDGEGRTALAAVPLATKEMEVAAHGFWGKTIALPEAIDRPLEVELEPGNELAVDVEGIPADLAGRIALHLVCTEPPFANLGDHWLPGWLVRSVTVGGCWSASPAEGVVNCACAEDGRLVLEDLRPGLPVKLRLVGGFQDVLLETDVEPLGRSEHRRVSLRHPEPKCVVAGRTLADDGTPLPRVRVTLRRGEKDTDSRGSDGEGRFTFSLQQPGVLDLTATKPGWVAEPRAVVADGASDASVEVRLQRSRPVAIDVLDPHGNRVPTARLEVRPPAGYLAQFPREDRAGRFHFDDLPPVPSRLRILLAGDVLERPIDPLVPEISIEVPAYGRIEFRWDPASVPASEANVYPVIVLRSLDSKRAPLTYANLAMAPGEFPVVWAGDYTLGLETYSNPTATSKERWIPLRPPVPVHVEVDRTMTVSLP